MKLPVIIQTVQAEIRHDFRQGRLTWLHQFAGQLIGVNHWDSVLGETVADGGFTAADAAGQANNPHSHHPMPFK